MRVSPRRPGRRRASPRSGAARRGRGRAAAEAARRRCDGRAPERGQVVAAAPALEREAEGRRLPVHDAGAGARDGRVSGRRPAHRRGHPGSDRRRQRGNRPGARVPRPPRARAAAAARDRLVRGGRRGALPHDRHRALALRRRPRRAPAGDRAEQDRPAAGAARVPGRGRADRGRLPVSCATGAGIDALKLALFRLCPAAPEPVFEEAPELPEFLDTGRSRRPAGRTGSTAPTAASGSSARPRRARSSRPC